MSVSSMEQATNLIIERAKQLFNQLVENRGHDKPPFLPEDFARLLGIKRPLKANLGKTSAVLLRFQDGYVIKINANHHPVRQNFSIAHEIGHILFSELNLQSYTGNIEYRTYNPQATERLRGSAKERLCDAVAAELLMPEQVFKQYLKGFGLSINSIEPLSHVFRTSIQTTAYRIAEVSEESCLTLIWKLWPPNKPKGLRCKFPKGKFKHIPLHAFVKHPSTLQKAFEGSSSVKSSKIFVTGNTRKSLPVESKGFGRGENRYVISLAFLDR